MSLKLDGSGGTVDVTISLNSSNELCLNGIPLSATVAVGNGLHYTSEQGIQILEADTNIFKGTKNAWDLLPLADKQKYTGASLIEDTQQVFVLDTILTHNVPRNIPKDITQYFTDGSLWNRLDGVGFSLFEDIYVGDYLHMSRAISAYERTGQYQETGSEYVTIADLDGAWGRGDSGNEINYHHLIMVPGKGLDPTEKQHFGRSRMNSGDSTANGYAGCEMNTTTIGAVASSGSTSSTATINQQLYAEFGAHLKTVRELVSNSINSSGYNRFGSATGCSNNWAWISVQAILMSEAEVYGTTVWSSSGYDTGTAVRQLALFQQSEVARNNRSGYYLLKDVASAAHFCNASSGGIAAYYGAGNATTYVRPRFILGA